MTYLKNAWDIPDILRVNQQKYLVEPALRFIDSNESDGQIGILSADTGNGKTYTVINGIIPAIVVKKINAGVDLKKESLNFIILAPSTELVDEIYETVYETYTSHEYNISSPGRVDVFNNFIGIKKTGINIVVTTIQTWLNNYANLNASFTGLFWDEIHHGGCPSDLLYYFDLGHGSAGGHSNYEARWYNSVIDGDVEYRFGFSGTPMTSHIESKEKYVMVSNDMPSASYSKPAVFDPIFTTTYSDSTEELVKTILVKNAIVKYLKEEKPEALKNFHQTKVTGILKVGSKAMPYNIWHARRDMKKFINQYQNTTIEYDGVTLNLEGGNFAVNNHNERSKGYDTSREVFCDLADNKSDLLFAIVVELGSVGINVPNLGAVALARRIENSASVYNNSIQYYGRLNRCERDFYFTAGEFSEASAEDRETIYNYFMATNCVQPIGITSSGSIEGVKTFVDKNVPSDAVWITLNSLNDVGSNLVGSSTSGSSTDRDTIYQKYKKNRCEIPGCDCYERYVSSPDEPSFSEMRFNERLHVYKAILDVDHIDGDRDNMVPSNLWTICSPQHKLKSYENGDYIS
jgi:hypothetical protein